MTARQRIPADFPVRPLRRSTRRDGKTTCLKCGLSWDDNKPTSYTPAPSGRCPFEAFHRADEPALTYGNIETALRTADYLARKPRIGAPVILTPVEAEECRNCGQEIRWFAEDQAWLDRETHSTCVGTRRRHAPAPSARQEGGTRTET